MADHPSPLRSPLAEDASRPARAGIPFGSPPAPLRGRAALVVAHPGHELRVHGWLESAHPLVFVLTDGSGGAGQPRLWCTSLLLEQAGARPGDLYGRLSDRDLYAALLDGEHHIFEAMAHDLAEALVRCGIDYVIGDAREGYNPAHDVCRLLVETAVALARSSGASILRDFDFPVVGPPAPSTEGGRTRLRLDDAALERKLRAASAYAPLRDEIAPLLAEGGKEAFRTEVFCERSCGPSAEVPPGWVPWYEAFGQRQVAAGRYRRVLRYAEHLVPLERRLSSLAALCPGSPPIAGEPYEAPETGRGSRAGAASASSGPEPRRGVS